MIVVAKFNGFSAYKAARAAWRYFGGCCTYVVLDNLKEGVIKPNLYEPELNSVYTAVLAHYGVVADAARVRDPNHKRTRGHARFAADQSMRYAVTK